MKVNPPASDQLAPDAVIVIFGAPVRPDGRPSQTLRRRVDAARFGAGFARPLFIPTGAKGRHGQAEAAVMAHVLMQAGYPRDAIVQEKTGTDTLSSVRAVLPLLPRQLRVYACTSAYHLPRCLLLLRIAGVNTRACPPPPVPATTSLWIRWYWRLREILALPYDACLMLWLRATGRI